MHDNIDRVVECKMAFNKRFRQHDGIFDSLDFSRREMPGGVGDVEVYIGHTTAIIRLLTIVSVPFAELLPVPQYFTCRRDIPCCYLLGHRFVAI